MKRIIPWLPPVALLGVALVVLLHRPENSPAPSPESPPDRPAPAPSGPGPDAPPAPAVETGTPALPATLTVYAHNAGRPLPGVRIRLSSPERHLPPAPDDPGSLCLCCTGLITSDSGTVRFSDLPPGPWRIFARHPRYAAISADTILRSGEARQEAVAMVEGGVIEGLVHSADGSPLGKTGISILEPVTLRPLHPELKALSDPETGAWRIEGIPLRTFTLHARHPRHKEKRIDGLAFQAPGERIVRDIKLEKANAVSGVVFDPDGLPLCGALVSASNETGSTARTGPDGTFTLSGLGDDTVRLFVRADGLPTVYRRNIPPGTLNIEIRLPRPARLRGSLSIEGAPPADFSILLHRYEEEIGKNLLVATRPVRESVHGRFELADIAPGLYRLSARAKGFRCPEPTVLPVAEGSTVTDIVIRMERE